MKGCDKGSKIKEMLFYITYDEDNNGALIVWRNPKWLDYNESRWQETQKRFKEFLKPLGKVNIKQELHNDFRAKKNVVSMKFENQFPKDERVCMWDSGTSKEKYNVVDELLNDIIEEVKE